METDFARRISEIISDLEAAGKLVCAAHMQFVLDMLDDDGPDRVKGRASSPEPSSRSQFMTSEHLDESRRRT